MQLLTLISRINVTFSFFLENLSHITNLLQSLYRVVRYVSPPSMNGEFID